MLFVRKNFQAKLSSEVDPPTHIQVLAWLARLPRCNTHPGAINNYIGANIGISILLELV